MVSLQGRDTLGETRFGLGVSIEGVARARVSDTERYHPGTLRDFLARHLVERGQRV